MGEKLVFKKEKGQSKTHIFLVIVSMFILMVAGCSKSTGSEQAPTSTVAPTVMPELLVTQKPTVTPEPSVTQEPTATPEPTVRLEPIATLEPTRAPEPTLELTEIPKLTDIPVMENEVDIVNVSVGFEFESNGDGTCTLIKVGNCMDTEIVIPEKSPEGDVITKIAKDAFYSADDIESIIFSGRTMEIDEKAFQFCELGKLIIENCNLKVGKGAFYYCENISEIIINNSQIEIESDAFYSGGKEMNLELSNCTGTIGDEAFQFAEIENIKVDNCTLEIGEKAFYYCENITSIIVEKGKITIGSDAFYSAGNKSIVSFIDCELNIDGEAFQFCDLAGLAIENCETTIGEKAFYYCESLGEVNIGQGDTVIGNEAFYGCSSLKNVSIAANAETAENDIVIEKKAFPFSAVEKVVIGKGNITIGDEAFYYCDSLLSVKFESTPLKAGKNIFYGCPDEIAVTYGDEGKDNPAGESSNENYEKEETKNKEENQEGSGKASGIRPEFKEAMDSYEAFFDEYVDFMKKYAETTDPMSMMGDYLEYMEQYTETMNKIAELEDGVMSNEEALYYAEVSMRVSQKLLEISQ